jgi:hypothetical protein
MQAGMLAFTQRTPLMEDRGSTQDRAANHTLSPLAHAICCNP